MIKEKIKEIMCEVFEHKDVNESSEMLVTNNWDSLGHVNLMMELEEEFDVEINGELIAKLISFQEIVNFIENK